MSANSKSATFRVAIVGSGPAGLAAAARAAQLGLSHVLIEKTDHLSDTIYKYQKGKHVMATPAQLVLRADLDFEAGKREKILGLWDEQTAAQKVNVHYNAEVKAIVGTGDPIPDSIMRIVTRGRDGTNSTKEFQRNAPPYRLSLSDGSEVIADTVILAIGTQGNPNTMRCPGADLPHIQYQLDDPGEYIDEHIVVVGTGDAGIENALGLAEDPEQRNVVTIVNRGSEFPTAKDANVQALLAAQSAGRVRIQADSETKSVEPGFITFETRDGEQTIRCDRIIARIGSAPPRGFVEQCGIEFSSSDRLAFPQLSPVFESTAPSIFIIGALAGYPLIKHCMNQGHDVVEFINGNTALKPADEPILEAKFKNLPGKRSVSQWLEFLRTNVSILEGMSPLQMREFMLDSEARFYKAGETILQRNDPGSSLFAIAQGSVWVLVSPTDPSIRVPIGTGLIFGEVGLVSGRKRGATIVAAEDAICVEISRTAALRLQSQVPAAKRAIERISTERQLLQMLKSGLQREDLVEVMQDYEVQQIAAGKPVFSENDEGNDVYVIRLGSMVVEKNFKGKPVFLNYFPAGNYVGAMESIAGGKRTSTVRAAIKSEVIKLNGDAFSRLLAAKPELAKKVTEDTAERQNLSSLVESKKDNFANIVDEYSNVANFLIENGIGEATDVLLIDEKLCVGCDNCEKACADSHDGLSRLDREAGKTYAHLHVPTSCRHCEQPHCMADCPPNAIHRGPDGEVYINDTCIGCGNCQRNCPYGVIRMEAKPPKKPSLLSWLFLGNGPGPGEPSKSWSYKNADPTVEKAKKAVKCDMCSGIAGGPACVRACPTGAAIRVSPEAFLTVARLERETG